MKQKLLCFALIALVTVACSEEEEPSDSRARVFFRADTLITLNSVYATLDDGASTWNFKPQNFMPVPSDSLRFMSPEVQTGSSGLLTMNFRLETDGGTTFSNGSLKAPMSPNWRWQFEIVHGPDSIFACSDCQTTTAYEIYGAGHTDEWIHVLWRGRGP